MNEYKYSIASLATNLKRILNVDIKPEHIRLAKFNKSEGNVVETFWKLLSALSGAEDESVRATKTKLLQLKYHRIAFYGLPDDKSDGSRELLIALCYLLSVGILDRTVSDIYNESVAETDNTPSSSHRPKFTEQNCDKITDWANGKIRINTNATSEYKTKITELTEKIRSGRHALSRFDSLTHNDVLRLYDANYTDVSRRATKVLESHEGWLRQAPLFWKWMGSVVAQPDDTEINEEEVERFFFFAPFNNNPT